MIFLRLLDCIGEVLDDRLRLMRLLAEHDDGGSVQRDACEEQYVRGSLLQPDIGLLECVFEIHVYLNSVVENMST